MILLDDEVKQVSQDVVNQKKGWVQEHDFESCMYNCKPSKLQKRSHEIR